MSEQPERIQVRCIGCQAIGYVVRKYFMDQKPCPKCGCALTDWVKIPGIKATPAMPKAANWDKRSYDDFHGDLAEIRGTGTEYAGVSKPRKLEDRNDFREFDV